MMRTFLLLLSFISFTACSTDSATEQGSGGGGGKAAKGGEGGGGSGGNQGDDAGTAPGDGSETEANVSTAGRCSGEHVDPPTGAGLGLTQDTAMSALSGTWHVGLTSFQEQCREVLNLAIRGDADSVAGLEDGDLKEWATLVAAKQEGGQGNRQEVSEAQEVFEKLQNLPDMTLTISDGNVQMAGQENFSGTLSVVSGEGDKFTVSCSPCDPNDQTVDIYFANSTKIYVTQGSGVIKGTTFDKIN
jgi:hypothetical protein